MYIVPENQLYYDLEARALETTYCQFVAHAPVSCLLHGRIRTRVNDNVLIARCLRPRLVQGAVDRNR
jgi:hypothetical protein